MLKFIKKHQLLLLIILNISLLILLGFVVTIKKYELLAPGDISSISSDIAINDRTDNNEFYSVYVTVYSNPSLFQLLYAKLSPNITIRNVNRDLYTPQEEFKISEVQEDISYKNALVLAYTKASEIDPLIYIEYEIESCWIFSSDVKEVKKGDIFTHINGESVKNYDDDTIFTMLMGKDPVIRVDGVDIVIEKEEYEIDVYFYPIFKITAASPDYNTFYEGDNKTGSSGGLIQALKIYSTLLNKKYNKVISGTGSITYYGSVLMIGGVHQKIYAVNKKVDIFFIPEHNYDEALKAYNKLKRPKFKLVKVSSFDEALEELEK